MKRITWLVACALLAATALPAFAGGDKCTQDAQTCLTHFSAKKAKGWLGLEYDTQADGQKVVKMVYKDSPAAKAGFQAGDALVSLNGATFSDKEAVKKAVGEWKVGQELTYVVARKGAEKKIVATLGAMSEDVFATIVGRHMVADHLTAENVAQAPPAGADAAAASTKPADK